MPNNYLAEYQQATSRPWRWAILRWCFLLLGLVAVYFGATVAIWGAWLGALIVAFLGVKRRWLFLLAQVVLVPICVGGFLWLDRFFAGTRLGPLPYSDDWLTIVPVAGIVMQVIFAAMAHLGRYQYDHNAYAEQHPFSRHFVEDELRRRERERQTR